MEQRLKPDRNHHALDPDAIPGFICAYHFVEEGPPTPCSEETLRKAVPPSHGWLWLHLNLADSRCARWLLNRAGVPEPAARDFAEPPSRQAIHTHGETLVGHVSALRHDFDHDAKDHVWLHFLLQGDMVVTGRNRAIQSAEHVRRKLELGQRFARPIDFLVGFLESYADRLDTLLHDLNADIELIEDHVLDDRHRGERRRLMLLRREAASHHRHARAQRRAMVHAERSIANFPRELEPLMTRLLHLDQDFDILEQRARFFHDEIDAKLAAETNRQLFILSALTAGFLPPALVAGLFGMNLQGIPWADHPFGFYIAVALSVASSAAVALFMWLTGRER
jgi:zinc transporter